MKKVYYKGFNSELQCDPTGKKPFQYEVGKTYEEPEAIIEKKGFHACENPLDVFSFYSPATSRYCEVELEDIADSNSIVTVAKNITIKKELSLNEMIQAAAKFNLDKTNGDIKTVTLENNSIAINPLYQSAAFTEGKKSIAIAKNSQSVAVSTDILSVAKSEGSRSVAVSTEYKSIAKSNGYQSAAVGIGYRSTAISTESDSVALSMDEESTAIAEGTESIAMAVGVGGKAKGAKGCYLVLAEWKNDGYNWHRTNVKSVLVDGEIIKADTFYMLKDGEFVEVE